MTNARASKIAHAKERATKAERTADEALNAAGFLREALISLLAEMGGAHELEMDTMRGYTAKGWDLGIERVDEGRLRFRAVGPPAERLDVERYVICPECAAEVVIDEGAEFVICPNVHEVKIAAGDVNERVVHADDAMTERPAATGALAGGEDSQEVG